MVTATLDGVSAIPLLNSCGVGQCTLLSIELTNKLQFAVYRLLAQQTHSNVMSFQVHCDLHSTGIHGQPCSARNLGHTQFCAATGKLNRAHFFSSLATLDREF